MGDKFTTLDWIVLVGYFVGILVLGLSFYRRTRSSEQFTAAGRSLSGWLCGLSIFATYLSSISYLGLPGKSFVGDWNPFVTSLALPLAALAAVLFFLPYYRNTGYVSAYAMLEQRFGLWARLYASTLYLLFHIARMGMVMYLMALPMAVIFGWDIRWVILATGIVVTLYAYIGGLVAVIWADAIQAIVLLVGALLAVYFIASGIPGGFGKIVESGMEANKFSLGSFSLTDLTAPTFFVVFAYGLCDNLRNFGIDQSYIQRYIAAENDREARKSVWLGALTYVPVSAFFLFIGTGLYAYFQTHAGELPEVQRIVLRQQALQDGQTIDVDAMSAAELSVAVKPQSVGDQVFPYFIAAHLPPGITGLLVAAIFSAAMSTVSTSLNSSATLVMSDFFQRFRRQTPSDRTLMMVLHLATAVWGVLGTCTAFVLIRYTQSALDMWWTLSSVIGAGLVGLFLAGMMFKRLTSRQALLLVVIETLLVAWLTWSGSQAFPESMAALRNPLHPFLTIVVGTLVIVGGGFLFSLTTRPPAVSTTIQEPHDSL